MLAFGLRASNKGGEGIARVTHGGHLTPREFQEGYMGVGAVACILEGCTAASAWPAGDACWSPAALLLVLGAETRIEAKDAAATVSFGDYCEYLCHPQGAALDDNPVYLWESLVDNDPAHSAIIGMFQVPLLFGLLQGLHTPGDAADLLSCAGDDGRLFGNHRWLLIGPPRSGSALHVDPLGTSAWNLLLLGKKLWCVFPPLGAAEAEDFLRESSADEELCAAQWFALVLPRLVALAAAFWAPALQPQCFIQHQGETVYIPAGHHHAVLNLTDTVCVTQNWAEAANYQLVCREVYAEDAIAEDDKDAWRLRVAEMRQEDESALCVHCGQDAMGRVFELFDDRPLCQPCQLSRSQLYALCTAQQAEAGGIFIWKLRGECKPPHVMGGPGGDTQLYSVQHIQSLRKQQGLSGVWSVGGDGGGDGGGGVGGGGRASRGGGRASGGGGKSSGRGSRRK